MVAVAITSSRLGLRVGAEKQRVCAVQHRQSNDVITWETSDDVAIVTIFIYYLFIYYEYTNHDKRVIKTVKVVHINKKKPSCR